MYYTSTIKCIRIFSSDLDIMLLIEPEELRNNFFLINSTILKITLKTWNLINNILRSSSYNRKKEIKRILFNDNIYKNSGDNSYMFNNLFVNVDKTIAESSDPPSYWSSEHEGQQP